MKKIIKSLRTKFKDHAPVIAAASIITTISVIAYYHKKYDGRFLKVSDEDYDMLKEEDGALVYDTPDGDFIVSLKALK